jgi:ABC-type transport system substrate-binding protein
MAVTVRSPWDVDPAVTSSRYVARVLTRLGYRARFALDQGAAYFSAGNRAQIGFGYFGMDYPQPSNFLGVLRCDADDPGAYCNPAADRLYDRALETQRTDPVRAGALWAALDRKLTDDAPWLNLANLQQTVVLSERVGNYQSNPKYGPLYGQMWVEK